MAVWVRSATPYAHVTLPGLDSFPVPRPSSYVEGDVLVALGRCDLSALFAATGWTEVASSTASGFFHVFTKIATASEPATYTFSNEGVLASAHFVIFCLGGVASSSQVGGVACDYVTETGNPLPITAPAFTSTISGSAVWLMMHYTDYAGYAFTPPSGYGSGPYDINLAGTYPVIYASALKDGITSGSIAAADGTINVSGSSAPFFTVHIGIASGSVDPIPPIFDSAIFDSVVFDTGPSSQTYTLSFTDNITTADETRSFSIRVRVADETLATIDESIFTVVSGSVINTATLTDALTVIDALLSSRFVGSTQSDSVLTTDALLSSRRIGSTQSDSVLTTDALLSSRRIGSTQSDSVLTTDALLSSRRIGSTQSDSVLTTDALLSSRSVRSTQSDSVLTTDGSSYSLVLIRTVEEALTVFDAITSSVTSGGTVNVVALSDLLTISDGPVSYVLASRLVGESLLAADSSLLRRMATAYIQESLSLSDVLTTYAIRTSILSDGMSVLDPSLVRSILARALLDELTVGDELDVLYVPGSSFIYDVRIRIGAAPADIVLGQETAIRVSWDSSLALSHDTMLALSEESLLEIGGY